MTARRLLGLALVAGLVALVAAQGAELVRNQRRQPPDRRLFLQRESDVERLAAASSSRVRARLLPWYWLARQLPGATLRVTQGTEEEYRLIRGLGDITIVPQPASQPLEVSREVADRLAGRATDSLDVDGATLHLIKRPNATEYQVLTVRGVPRVIASRDDFTPRRVAPR